MQKTGGARAVLRYVRIAPRKCRIVVDAIRGRDLDEALAILAYTPKRAAPIIEKLVRSAAANATENHDMRREDLYVSEAYVDQGPTLKRAHPRYRGQMYAILKRTSHITVVVRERGV
ncbi:MAG: 50S ribosomal protein L22 [Thermaerobacter sp.]|nr:50S ribosomal protein L22 [Thermaerobacter sp.]